ncbi:hypothetical protein PANO111632_00530 [Paracoccus nototheniae]
MRPSSTAISLPSKRVAVAAANVLRDRYILNGGNPTAGLDPNEVVGTNEGNNDTDGYATAGQPDADNVPDGVDNRGAGRLP